MNFFRGPIPTCPIRQIGSRPTGRATRPAPNPKLKLDNSREGRVRSTTPPSRPELPRGEHVSPLGTKRSAKRADRDYRRGKIFPPAMPGAEPGTLQWRVLGMRGGHLVLPTGSKLLSSPRRVPRVFSCPSFFKLSF